MLSTENFCISILIRLFLSWNWQNENKCHYRVVCLIKSLVCGCCKLNLYHFWCIVRPFNCRKNCFSNNVHEWASKRRRVGVGDKLMQLGGYKLNRHRQIESGIQIWSSILVRFKIQQRTQVDNHDFDLNLVLFLL